jgi:hypothetical protein
MISGLFHICNNLLWGSSVIVTAQRNKFTKHAHKIDASQIGCPCVHNFVSYFFALNHPFDSSTSCRVGNDLSRKAPRDLAQRPEIWEVNLWTIWKTPPASYPFPALFHAFEPQPRRGVSKHVMLSVLATQTQELWIFACGRMRGSKVWKWFFTLWSCDSLCEHEAKWHVQLCIHFTLTRLGFCLFLIHWSSHKVHSYFSSFHWQGTRWSDEYVKWQDINIVSSQFSHMNGFFCPYLFLFRPKKSRRLQGW